MNTVTNINIINTIIDMHALNPQHPLVTNDTNDWLLMTSGTNLFSFSLFQQLQ